MGVDELIKNYYRFEKHTVISYFRYISREKLEN